jgi:hypothetical protein
MYMGSKRRHDVSSTKSSLVKASRSRVLVQAFRLKKKIDLSHLQQIYYAMSVRSRREMFARGEERSLSSIEWQ